MKTITSSELRQDSPSAYNEVHLKGRVRISHRDRPPMVLITESELNKIEEKQPANISA